MANPDFANVGERLLRGGIAPKHVRRIVAELRDHHADLVAEATGRGCSTETAAAEARTRLGDDETLIAEVLGRHELRSWAHRWPWAIYGLTPLLAFVTAIVTLLSALFVPIAIHSGTNRWNPPAWYQVLAAVVRDVAMFGLPLVVAVGLCLAAAKRRASPPWPMVGVTLVSLVGGALDLELRWPQAGHPGSLSVGLSLLPPFPNLGAMVVRTTASLLLVLAPFLWCARQQASRAC